MSWNKENACSVTGHRIMSGDIEEKTVYDALYKLAESGINAFLVGMAIGVDTLCFHVLEKIRKVKDIRIIACVPCGSQAEKFSFKVKKEYGRMLSVADEIIYVSREYTSYCMIKRNMYMVDNSSVLVAYKRRESGGSANTVNYALKCGVKVIEL